MREIPDHSMSPGIPATISFSRFNARMYRLLAADFLIPRIWAVSPLLSISKCRSARISRSMGSTVQDFLESDLRLGPYGRMAGRGQPAHELGSQRDGRRLRQGAAVKRDLLGRVAHLCPKVLPVPCDQFLPRNMTQPEKEPHGRLPHIVPQPLAY